MFSTRLGSLRSFEVSRTKRQVNAFYICTHTRSLPGSVGVVGAVAKLAYFAIKTIGCKVSIFCNKNHCGLKLSDLNLILHDTCTERTGGAGTLRIRTKKAALCVAFRNPHGKRFSAGLGAKKKYVRHISKYIGHILKYKAHIFSLIIFGVFRWAIQWSKNLFFSVTFNSIRSLGN